MLQGRVLLLYLSRHANLIVRQLCRQGRVGHRKNLDGKKTGERSTEPYALVWDAVPGEHTLQIRAVDQAGNQGRSEEITFTVE